MAHATHFLERLNRVSMGHADQALALYRDPKLVRETLKDRVPEGADRLAIALGPADTGPYVVVSREGGFITCLAEGMIPGDLKVITSEQLAATRARLEQERRGERLAHEMPGGLSELLCSIINAGSDMTREQMTALEALHPLVGQKMSHRYFETGARLGGGRPAYQEHARRPLHQLTHSDHLIHDAIWRGSWALGHLAVLLGMDRTGVAVEVALQSQVSFSLACYLPSIAGVALRGAWAASRVGKPSLGVFKREFDSGKGFPIILDAVLSLVGIALRHSATHAEIEKHIARKRHHPGDELLAALCEQALLMLDNPGQRVALLPGVLRDNLETWAPWAGQRVRAIPEEHLVPAWLSMPVPLFSEPSWLTVWPAMILTVGWLARAEAHELYLPAGVLEPLTLEEKARCNWELLRAPSPFVKAPVRIEHPPGPNEPCRCGSGKKYKRCCALKTG
jgi:hypothetical protein